MSAFLDRADAIAAHLGTIESLEGIDVIVDRQKELDSALKKSIAKKKGAGIGPVCVRTKRPKVGRRNVWSGGTDSRVR